VVEKCVSLLVPELVVDLKPLDRTQLVIVQLGEEDRVSVPGLISLGLHDVDFNIFDTILLLQRDIVLG